MLTEDEFSSWCCRMKLPQEVRALITRIRVSHPSRRVGGGHSNVSGRYPSRKMGVTIQFESHRVELPFVYEMEHQPDVLEYYDQPFPIPLIYEAVSGRRLSVQHTPDFFVIRRDCAGWEECKKEDELVRLEARNPKRYQRDEQGCWRCPPGESLAAQSGLYYSVRSSSEINWTLQRNLNFLEDYLRARATTPDAVINSVRSFVAGEPGLPLDSLFDRVKSLADRDMVYLLLAGGHLYVDLNTDQVFEPQHCRVFTSPEQSVAYEFATHRQREEHSRSTLLIAVGEQFSWDGKKWKVANLGDEHLSLLNDDGSISDLPLPTLDLLIRQGRIRALDGAGTDPQSGVASPLSKASEPELATANYRFSLIHERNNPHLADDKHTIPQRTLRHWARSYRDAKEIYGNGYVGLLPKIAQRGNRTPRLPSASIEMLMRFIEEDYESLKQKSRRASWAMLKLECDKCGMAVPSYKTFCLAVKRRPSYGQTLKRQGRRAAYKYEETYWELSATTPRHGDRPFEIGHIDHTELDVEVVCANTGRCLGRPWMSILIDAFSRRCLAVHLSFDPPSYRSCMMLLRECVRRHGRFPQTVIVDGGAEFHGTYFETLLARYECVKKMRPPAKARFGSICERIFGTTNSQFVHNLRGNTQLSRNVRQVTRSVAPKGQAAWTFGELSDRLEEYLYESYDQMSHVSLGQSPRDAFESGLKESGYRPQRRVAFDLDFKIATLPTTPKGTAKIVIGRGVKINGIYYWSDAFRNPTAEGHNVPVRYDPFDAGTAYAFIAGQWTRCHSEYRSSFQGKSEKEIQLASRLLHRRWQIHGKDSAISAKKLAEFLQSVEHEETLLLQRMRDREAHRAYQLVAVSNPQLDNRDILRKPTENGYDSPATPVKIYGAF